MVEKIGAKREKGEKAKRGKTMRQPDLFDLFAVSLLRRLSLKADRG
jgi:hypothetical protein